MLQVQVKLKMEQPKCRARVEFHPRPERERLLHFETALEALKIIRETVKTAVKLKKENADHEEINLFVRGLLKTPKKILKEFLDLKREDEGKKLLYSPTVVWESADGFVELGNKFAREITLLAFKVMAGEYSGYGKLAEKMAEFYSKWGPIFKEKAMPEGEIWHRLALLAWTAACWQYLPTNPPALNNEILDHILIKPLEKTKEMWAGYADPSNWSGFLLHMYVPGKISFIPVEKGRKIGGDGYCVYLPAKLPDWKRLDVAVSWVRKVVLSNVKEILNSVEYKTYVDSEGNLQLIAQPRDAYSLALLRIIWGNGSKPRKCACGCGLYTFTKWYHPSHQRRGQVKQNVLAYWRTQKNRGKISEGEYELIKAEINRLWSEEIKEKGKLAEAVKAFVAKNHPRP